MELFLQSARCLLVLNLKALGAGQLKVPSAKGDVASCCGSDNGIRDREDSKISALPGAVAAVTGARERIALNRIQIECNPRQASRW
jgi:hypothetical protein